MLSINYLKNKLGLDKEELLSRINFSKCKEKTRKNYFCYSNRRKPWQRNSLGCSKKLGHDCVVYVHEKTARARIDAIKSYGAQVKIIPGNYD
jgi:hypothetical protein